MHVGPHPRRLNGTLGTSHSSAPFRNRSEAFDTAWPSQSLEQAKVPRAVLPESPSEARPERTECTTHPRSEERRVGKEGRVLWSMYTTYMHETSLKRSVTYI